MFEMIKINQQLLCQWLNRGIATRICLQQSKTGRGLGGFTVTCCF